MSAVLAAQDPRSEQQYRQRVGAPYGAPTRRSYSCRQGPRERTCLCAKRLFMGSWRYWWQIASGDEQ
jgi:hypothetical protein